MNKIGEIKNSIDQLFQVMGIKRVIFVDDVFDPSPGLEIVMGLSDELGDRAKEIVPEFANIDFDAPRVIINTQISSIWEGLESGSHLNIINRLRGESQTYQENDHRISILQGIFTKGDSLFEYFELSPEEWSQRKQEYLKKSQELNTLILFDQILGSRSGMDEITDILSDDQGTNVTCGLISATFEPVEEEEKWREFAEEKGIDKERFALISKAHLREDEPIGFVIALKRVVLNKQTGDLIDLVSTVISFAHEEAKKKVQDLDIYNFEQIVFRSSFQEGAWEPDTLFRVFGLFHRAYALKEARDKAELHRLTATLRQLSLIGANTDLLAKKALSIREIRRLELYDEGENLNSHYLPIDQGDIFVKVPGNKKFILLTQSCDLMVRTSDGKRKPAVREGILAEIVMVNGEIKYPEMFYELPYFDSQEDQRFYVNLLNTHSINLFVLDICSFHAEGKATFTVGGNCPEIMIPAWQKHFSELNDFFGKTIKLYKELREKDISKAVCNDLIKGKISSGPFALASVDSNRDSIRFAFKRLRRLRQPYSADLVTNFAHFISRAAFEHDLARVDNG